MPAQEKLTTYIFRISPQAQPHVWRTIEFLSSQTLGDLHLAIQNAFDLPADRPAAFFLSGKKDDPASRYTTLAGSGARLASNHPLQTLSLKSDQTFLYLYDEQHGFRVQRLGANPNARARRYPKIIEKQGEFALGIEFEEAADETSPTEAEGVSERAEAQEAEHAEPELEECEEGGEEGGEGGEEGEEEEEGSEEEGEEEEEEKEEEKEEEEEGEEETEEGEAEEAEEEKEERKKSEKRVSRKRSEKAEKWSRRPASKKSVNSKRKRPPTKPPSIQRKLRRPLKSRPKKKPEPRQAAKRNKTPPSEKRSTAESARVDFSLDSHQRVRINGDQLEIGNQRLRLSESLDCGDSIGVIPAQSIAQASEQYARLTNGKCQPQFAALVFEATRQPRALDFYFPLTKILTKKERSDFDQLVQSITQQPNFDLRLIGEFGNDLTSQMPVGVAHLVAGHLAEIFFYRRDILERFLSAPRHIALYATPWAFERDGGQAGGTYHSDRETLQLVLARLFEGFYQPTPGVAPFLHEFGHMLDFFDAGTGRMGRSQGLLPGLSPQDGAVYTPRARKLFLKGKRLELERYLLRYQGKAKAGDPLPIGHPYVFQNDTEFAAGYFEMFFRNPNYFADQNPDLYQAYVELFGYDPRRAWKEDFPFYINENRNFYLSGQKPWTPNLTIPGT